MDSASALDTVEGASETAAPPVPRSTRGTFVKGHSGNPLGKAKGTRNHITLQRLETEEALRDFLAPHAKKLLKRSIDLAMSGDVAMMKVLMDKMLSSLRTEDVGETKDTNVVLTINNLTATAKDRRGEVVVDGEIVSPPTSVTVHSLQVHKAQTPGNNE